MAFFESQEEVLLDCIRQRSDASAQWHKYANSYGLLFRCLFNVSWCIKSELCRGRLFGFYESDLG